MLLLSHPTQQGFWSPTAEPGTTAHYNPSAARSYGAAGVGREWEPCGDPQGVGRLYHQLGFSIGGHGGQTSSLILSNNGGAFSSCEVSPEQVLERNEPDPCPWQQRWIMKWGDTATHDFDMIVSPSFQIWSEVSLLRPEWAERSSAGLLQCVNVSRPKSPLGLGPKRSNGGFTRLINKPWAK